MLDWLRPFAKDKPEFPGGLALWLDSGKGGILNGRHVSANCSVDELVEWKEKTMRGRKLEVILKGVIQPSL